MTIRFPVRRVLARGGVRLSPTPVRPMCMVRLEGQVLTDAVLQTQRDTINVISDKLKQTSAMMCNISTVMCEISMSGLDSLENVLNVDQMILPGLTENDDVVQVHPCVVQHTFQHPAQHLIQT